VKKRAEFDGQKSDNRQPRQGELPGCESAVLAVDAGSVAVGVVIVDRRRRLLKQGYAFHHGNIPAALASLLTEEEIRSVRYLAATTSTPHTIAAQQRYDNQVAITAAARAAHPQLGALLNVGGERFSLATFDEDGHYQSCTTNTSCAAGTGSFLDQQAGRLRLGGIEDLAALAGNCGGAVPRIASRCAVFAKTDLIHAQQEGYQLKEISSGLCRGLAKNIADTLFSGRHLPRGTVVFCGGVAKNQAVVNALAELTGLKFTVPDNCALYGAFGAALLLLEDLDAGLELPPRTLECLADLQSRQVKGARSYFYPPLALHHSSYPDFSSALQYTTRRGDGPEVEVDIYHLPGGSEVGGYFLGIDIGSTSTKAVLVDRQGEVFAGLYTRTAGRPLQAVQDIFSAMEEIALHHQLSWTIIGCGTTGSGRKFIGKLIGADSIVDEITAHARAACQLNPDVDTIIEIGGQDAKFTTLRNGRVTSSTMNNVCAAGTGSFIEEQAEKLGCPIRDYARRTEGVAAPMTSDRCTVFMERDINHFLSEGYSVEEVLAAALHSVRENYLLKVATERHIGKTVMFQGATARNKSLVAAFEQRLERPILVSRFCHLTGALGTALLLRDEGISRSSFVGTALHRKTIPVRGEVCELCANHCKITIADIDGQEVAYGFLCGRDYHSQRPAKKASQAIDLLAERRRLCRVPTATAPKRPVIGLPAAVHLVDELPLWQKFFQLLGIATLSSERYARALSDGKKLSQAEFCAPITAMHGHAEWLLSRCDYLFLPFYLENKKKNHRRQYCYYTQFLPALIPDLPQGRAERFLRPVLRYLYTPFHTKMQLYRMLQKVEADRWSFLEVSSAYDQALAFDQACRRQLKDLYRQGHPGKDEIRVVFLGRPYTLFSPELNGNIPQIFQNLGINTAYQDMLDYRAGDTERIAPLLAEIHWEYAARILEAAEVIGAMDNTYPVYVTSFKCSPDSFALEYFKTIMEHHRKPYLILELDEHDSSVGYETRIESALRSFRNHAQQSRRAPAPSTDHRLIPHYATSLAGRQVFFPNWDNITCRLLAATLRREGYPTQLLQESEQTIRESLKHNTGQCIPLNAVAQAYLKAIRDGGHQPGQCVLWLNRSYLSCNIRLYPFHIRQILADQGDSLEEAAIYQGSITFADISFRAAKNAYFAYMIGGLLRKVGCRIRPYEVEKGLTDRILDKSVQMLEGAFAGKRPLENCLEEVISRFQWIETRTEERPKVAIFGDLYSRDNEIMNQGLLHFIEAHGGEVITTPYNEYAKMVAASYFRKWFNEGKYFDMLTGRALLTAMTALEKRYRRLFQRILDEPEHSYDDDPQTILNRALISIENTGESTDNILKIHYILKHHPDVSLLVQASPALCCASLVTEAMKQRIEESTGVPVVSVTYDGTGGGKNEVIIPYLRYPRRRRATDHAPLFHARGSAGT
jgi:predicted CoA-substrate-specific enzyme activase